LSTAGEAVLDSESVKKDLQCTKYEMKKQKSPEVSEVVLIVDPSVLKFFQNDFAAAKSAADDAKTTGDEIQKESSEAKDAAAGAQHDATSAQMQHLMRRMRLIRFNHHSGQCLEYECN
jgi:hypothetical protein